MGTDKLQYLIEVERCGSISKAADALYISQPSLSKNIASIEKELGCRLFERTSTGLIPTREGRRFLSYAHQVLSLRQETVEDIRRLTEERQAGTRFKLGVSTMRSTETLSRSLVNYINTITEVPILCTVGYESELEAQVVSGALDLAVITMPESGVIDPSLSVMHLANERLVLAIQVNDPILERTEQRKDEVFPYLAPEELKNQRFILPQNACRIREMIDRFFYTEGIVPEVTVFEDYADFSIREAAMGIGIAFVNERLAKVCQEKNVQFCYTAGSLPIREVCAVWRKTDEERPDKMQLYRMICDDWQVVRWDSEEGDGAEKNAVRKP